MIKYGLHIFFYDHNSMVHYLGHENSPLGPKHLILSIPLKHEADLHIIQDLFLPQRKYSAPPLQVSSD